MGNKDISLKDYSSRTAEQNVTNFDMNHHWGKRNQFCITLMKVMAPRGKRDGNHYGE